MRIRLSSLLALLSLLAAAGCRTGSAGLRGEAPTPVTTEWIYGTGQSLDDVPSFAWLEDGRLLLWDGRRAVGERTIEVLDPASGERRALVDREQARASLKGAAPDVEGATYGWPEAFDRTGSLGLYVFDGDLYLLHTAESRFERLTETDAEEKAARFSPDGRQVAFVRENDLHVVDVATRSERRLTSDGSETLLNGTLSWVYWEEIHGRHDLAYWWSEDSRSIAFLQTDESPVGIARFLKFEDPYAELIEQRYPKAGTPNPIVRVGVIDLNAARQEPVWVELPDFEYLARVNWLPEVAGQPKRLAVQTLTRDQRRVDVYLADAATGAASAVLSETDEAWVNLNDDLCFLEDGQHFLWVSERSGFAHLYLYTLDGRLVRQLTDGDWALASAGGGVSWLRQTLVGVDETARMAYVTGQREGSIQRQLYRVSLDGGPLERVTQRPGTHRITFDPAARRYVDAYSRLDLPAALELHDTQTGASRVLAAPATEALAAYDLQTPELLEIPARDGFEMPAWLLKPRDFDPSKRYPVVLYIYGGPSAPTVADAWGDHLLFDNMLLDAGYLVARCDNRSSAGISKRLESLVLHRSIGDVERNDLVDAARWLKALPFVDADRVGIWGWSAGGSNTLLMLTRSQEFAAGVSVAPVTDWRYYDTRWAEFAMKTPEENPEGYRMTSVAEHAKDLHGRLLLVHGTYDDNVHPQNAWRFANELIEANVPFDMMIYPLRKHGISDAEARIHLFNKMLEFWKLYL